MNYLQIVANHIIKLDSVSSTNEYAIQLLSKTEPSEGTVITTSFQTNGRGQYGRKWQSDPNQSLLLSLILKPSNLEIKNIFFLNMCISLAIRDFVSIITKKEIKIKWPNDIYINNKKIAGILIQNQISSLGISSSIIGIGINVNQTSFEINNANPTSLSIVENISYNLDELYEQLYPILDSYYLLLRNKKYQKIKTLYIQNLYKLNESSKFKLADGGVFTGNIIDIASNGAIVIKSQNQEKEYMMYEISMVKGNE